MENASKGVAWICIFSTLLMGCYSSALIDPTGEGNEKISSGKIFDVVTKDGTEYKFDTATTVVRDTVVGELRTPVEGGFSRTPVSIPLSDIALVSVKEPNTTLTWVLVGSLVMVAVGWWLGGNAGGGSGNDDGVPSSRLWQFPDPHFQ